MAGCVFLVFLKWHSKSASETNQHSKAMELDLSGVINDLGSHLYREGEESGSVTKRGLFTWRKTNSEEKPNMAKKKSSALIAPTQSNSSEGFMGSLGLGGKSDKLAEFCLIERLQQHKAGLTSIVWLQSKTPQEVWTLDVTGVVNRWSTSGSGRGLLRKGTRDTVGTFQTSSNEGYGMAVCGNNVWIASGNETEVYDFSGVLVWKIEEKARAFLEFGNCVWCGGEGGVSLYDQDKLALRVDFEGTEQVFVTSLVRVGCEIWASHGKSLSIISEETAKIIGDLPSVAEGRINDMIVGKGFVWIACENGKVMKLSVETRDVVNSIQAHEGRAFALMLSSSRLWTCR